MPDVSLPAFYLDYISKVKKQILTTGHPTHRPDMRPVLLQNTCIDGLESNYAIYVNTGIQLEFWASNHTDFIDCRITLTSGREMVGLVWRDLILAPTEQKMPGCERAFVELSTPKSKLYKFCGRLQDMPPFHQNVEFPNIPITLRLFINFSTPETPSTWLPTAVTNTAATPVSSTSVFNVTAAPNFLPNVKIILDVTAFSYCASLDAQSFMCRQSRRCLDKSLRCDELLNCVSPVFRNDKSDEIQCQEPPPLSLMPLWVTLGALGGCLVAYWCFYKPGYLPWRLARCRNARCCGRCLNSRRSSVGSQKGCFNCWSRSNGRSVSPTIKPATQGSSIKFSTAHNGDVQIINNDKNFKYQTPVVDWMSIKYDDGNHQRELR